MLPFSVYIINFVTNSAQSFKEVSSILAFKVHFVSCTISLFFTIQVCQVFPRCRWHRYSHVV